LVIDHSNLFMDLTTQRQSNRENHTLESHVTIKTFESSIKTESWHVTRKSSNFLTTGMASNFFTLMLKSTFRLNSKSYYENYSLNEATKTTHRRIVGFSALPSYHHSM